MAKDKVMGEFLPADEIIDVEFGKQSNTATDRAEDEWADFLSGADSTATVYLYRQPGDGRSQLEFVDSFPVDQFNPDNIMKWLRDKCGGGAYRIQVRQKGRVLSNKLVNVAGIVGSSNALMPVSRGDPVTMALIERLERMEEKLTSRANPMEQIKEMASMMAVFREIMGPPPAPVDPIKQMTDALAMMSQLRDISDGFGGGAEKPGLLDKLVDALPQLLPAVAQTMSKAKPVPRQQPQPQAKPVPPRDVTPQAKPVPTVEEKTPVIIEGMTAEQTEQFKTFISKGCMAASFGMSPETVADKIMDNVPEDQLVQIVNLPDVIDSLIVLEPAVADHREWFGDVLEWVKGHLGLPCKFDAEFDDGEPEIDDGEAETPNGEVDSQV